MAIRSGNLNIWVCSDKDEGMNDVYNTLIDGFAFDGNYGFGEEYKISYKGKVRIIGENGIIEMDQDILKFRSSTTGYIKYNWTLKKINMCPPYLISSVDNVKMVFNKIVSFELEDSVKEFLMNDDECDSYPLYNGYCIGVISTIGYKDKYKLVLYSDRNVERTKLVNKLFIVDTDEAFFKTGSLQIIE